MRRMPDLRWKLPPGNDETYDASALGTYDPRLDLSRYVFPHLGLAESV